MTAENEGMSDCCRCGEPIHADQLEPHIDPVLQAEVHPSCCVVCWPELAGEYGVGPPEFLLGRT